MVKLKEISTRRFEIALYENLGYYIIRYTGDKNRFERIVGYTNADELFQMKLVELEGN